MLAYSDHTEIFGVEDDKDGDEYDINYIIIPCRPTTKNIVVKLFKNDEEVSTFFDNLLTLLLFCKNIKCESYLFIKVLKMDFKMSSVQSFNHSFYYLELKNSMSIAGKKSIKYI